MIPNDLNELADRATAYSRPDPSRWDAEIKSRRDEIRRLRDELRASK